MDALRCTKFLIFGMRSDRCREVLTNAVRAIEGVHDARVSLLHARAQVWYRPPCTSADVAWAIIAAGYGIVLASDAPTLAEGEHRERSKNA